MTALSKLLTWYDGAKRDLPWRRTQDPYAIWLSEAMLQQTRVETVIDYWKRFLVRFPDVASLARADEEEVVAQWSGLGYYRRARQLHAAARVVVEEFDGEFPQDAKSLRELPGVGRYTAGAVASIAFGRAEPLVDGNVARVFCRFFELDGEPHSKELEKTLWELAEKWVSKKRPGDWNQALMELGATVCTSTSPRCTECPLRTGCQALASGRVEELPRPKRKVEPIDVELEVLLIERRGRVLLERRSSSAARMADMWELPTREETGSDLFPAEYSSDAFEVGEKLGALRHSITRHRIRATVSRAALAPGTRLRSPFAWHAPEEALELALTGMAKKALARFAPSVTR